MIRERGCRVAPRRVPQREGHCAQLHPPARAGREPSLYADEAGGWNALHGRYTLHRINHQEAYSLLDAAQTHTNNAEGFFSRMRRAEIGHHHHIAGPICYGLRRKPPGAGVRKKREANGTQVDRIVALAMGNKPSVDFCGYWQRRDLNSIGPASRHIGLFTD